MGIIVIIFYYLFSPSVLLFFLSWTRNKTSRSYFCHSVVICIRLIFPSKIGPRRHGGNFQKYIYFLQNQDVPDWGDLWGWGYKVTQEGLVQWCCSWPLLSPCPKSKNITQKKRPWNLSYCDVHRKQVVGMIKPTLLGFLTGVWGSIYLCSFSAKQLRDTVVLEAGDSPKSWTPGSPE